MSGNDEGSVTALGYSVLTATERRRTLRYPGYAGALRNNAATLPSIQSSGENKMHAR